TPGPLIIIVAYVGFLGGAHQGGWAQPLAAGAVGACVATFFTFLPSFIFIFAGAPWIEHTRRNIALHAPLRAISAAVVGVIVSLALYFATHVFWVQSHVEWGAVGIAVLAALMQFRWRWGVVRLVLACAALGACYIALSTYCFT
ncbi:MAG: chromate transporter, partial [Betaproteobacteria bacterium]|nr:chromate transporter [Betaproteobacteria bacterium]